MIELEDGGKDLVVKILDLLLLSYQLLKFKVRDLEEKSSRDLVVHFIDSHLSLPNHALMSKAVNVSILMAMAILFIKTPVMLYSN